MDYNMLYAIKYSKKFSKSVADFGKSSHIFTPLSLVLRKLSMLYLRTKFTTVYRTCCESIAKALWEYRLLKIR